MSTVQKMTGEVVPEVGRYYLVPCRAVHGTSRWYPIHGPLHDDRDIGIAAKHHHVDLRFMSKRQILRWIVWRNTNLPPEVEAMTQVIGDTHGGRQTAVFYRKVMCKRQMPQFPALAWQERIGRRFAGHCLNLEHPVCPHKGFSLTGLPQDADGIVTCPGHGLRWNLRTGRLVARQAERREVEALVIKQAVEQ